MIIFHLLIFLLGNHIFSINFIIYLQMHLSSLSALIFFKLVLSSVFSGEFSFQFYFQVWDLMYFPHSGYKKVFNDPDNHDGVITHLEPDILECKVKRALGSITATKLVEVMDFQLSYFRSSRWCCESSALNMPANLENSAVATGLENVGFHSNPNEKKCSNYFTVALISHTHNSPS